MILKLYLVTLSFRLKLLLCLIESIRYHVLCDKNLESYPSVGWKTFGELRRRDRVTRPGSWVSDSDSELVELEDEELDDEEDDDELDIDLLSELFKKKWSFFIEI